MPTGRGREEEEEFGVCMCVAATATKQGIFEEKKDVCVPSRGQSDDGRKKKGEEDISKYSRKH